MVVGCGVQWSEGKLLFLRLGGRGSEWLHGPLCYCYLQHTTSMHLQLNKILRKGKNYMLQNIHNILAERKKLYVTEYI